MTITDARDGIPLSSNNPCVFVARAIFNPKTMIMETPNTNTFLTPDEARRLAEVLNTISDEMEASDAEA